MAKKIIYFEDLAIWVDARAFANQIYQVTQGKDFAKNCCLCDQLQRAAVSIMSNIAEGFERGSNRDFIRFLYIAKASAGEARSLLHLAMDRGYLEQSSFESIQRQVLLVSKQIGGFIKYLAENELKKR